MLESCKPFSFTTHLQSTFLIQTCTAFSELFFIDTQVMDYRTMYSLCPLSNICLPPPPHTYSSAIPSLKPKSSVTYCFGFEKCPPEVHVLKVQLPTCGAGDDGTFRRWGPAGRIQVTVDAPLKEMLGPQLLLSPHPQSLLPRCHKVSMQAQATGQAAMD